MKSARLITAAMLALTFGLGIVACDDKRGVEHAQENHDNSIDAAKKAHDDKH